MKHILIALLLTVASFNVRSDILGKSNLIEDIAAVLVSRSECGYDLNEHTIKVSFKSVSLTHIDLLPGGQFREEFNTHITRINKGVHQPGGRLAFCNNVKEVLGALIKEQDSNTLGANNNFDKN